MNGKTLFLGSFIHSKSLDELEYLHDAAVFVDEKGTIVAIEQACDQKKAEETVFPKLGWESGDVSVRAAKEGEFFFPGFIGLFPFSSFKEESADKVKIRTSTPLNTPTQASSARRPFWIG
jgi:hypothetical protein